MIIAKVQISSERSVRETTKTSSADVANKEIPQRKGERKKQTTKKEQNFFKDLDQIFDISLGDKEQVIINYFLLL